MTTTIAGAPLDISVVIPTLGGPSLESTIAALNAGTVTPAEILLCLPTAEAATVRSFPWPNVRVVATDVRGQVGQRASGFGQVVNSLVLQLDDDLIVASDCLERLRASLLSFPFQTAVSPALIDAATNESVYWQTTRRPLVSWLNRWLTNGGRPAVPGRVLATGGVLGVDAPRGGLPDYDVEWLAGGCILHHRSNLVLDNFYPFRGKAFCEDVIHSHYLRQRGIALKIDAGARVSVDVPPSVQPWLAFHRELLADLRARRYFMQLSGRPTFVLCAFAISRWLGYLVDRVRGGSA